MVPRRRPTLGVVLAGGKGSRMGASKAELPLTEELGEDPGVSTRSLASWAWERLDRVCDQVVAASGGLDGPWPRSVRDGPGRGPVAGILGAADAEPQHDLLVLACDLPFVPASLLRQLVDRDGDWVVPVRFESTRTLPEPTCALYRRRCLERLRQRVANGQWSLYPLLDEKIDVQTLEIPSAFGAETDPLANVNTPDELRAVRVTLKEQPHLLEHLLKLDS